MAAVSEETGLRRRRRGASGTEAAEVENNVDDDAKLDKLALNNKNIWRPPPPPQRVRLDVYLEVTVLVISFAARFFFLGEPKAVVFDEFHFGKFVNWTLRREYYFDIHPPLGKLLMAGWGWLVGYRPVDGFNYDKIGHDYGETLFYTLREFSAFFGTLTPLFAYRSGRLLGFEPMSAFISALCIALDLLHVIETRLILMDSQLIFYCVLSMYCALVLWRTTKPGTKKRWLWLLLTGMAAGAAFSIKWTALAFPGIIAVISFFGLYFLEEPLTLIECAFAGAMGLIVYTVPYYIHFKILTKSGTGDNFMERGFRHLLLGNPGYDASLKPPSFLYNFLYLNRRMFISNKGISAEHNWASFWYQWIVNWRGILYFRKHSEGDPKLTRLVYLMSNPVVCWLSFAAIFIYMIILVCLVRFRESTWWRKRRDVLLPFIYTGAFCFSSWLANLLPYILVDRSAFAYHYLPGLYFAELALGLVINGLPRGLRHVVSFVIIIAIVAAYIYWCPWAYAIPLTEEQHGARRWLPRWN